MKRIFLGVLFMNMMAGGAIAQITSGGIPWSFQAQRSASFTFEEIPSIQLATPDYGKVEQEDLNAVSGPYRTGIQVDADISPTTNGKWIYLEDGRKIWTLQVVVDGALAMDAFFDQFYLPKGVSFYLINENGQQIVGAYTYKNNRAEETYITNLVQGSVMYVELDVPADVNISDIRFHINKITSYYRGGMAIGLHNAFQSTRTTVARPTDNQDSSDPCQVNAVCGPWGTAYEDIKQTAMHIYIPMGNGVGVCSGNLLNNAREDCEPFFLTASHCELTNSFQNATYANWRFFQNYEFPNCVGDTTPAPYTDYVLGATFLARSEYDNNSNQMKGDFLLLKLNDPNNDLAAYNSYLAGWDRNIYDNNKNNGLGGLDTAISFHHPGGNAKKLSLWQDITPDGDFNGGAPNTHWSARLKLGGSAGGSSGSGLFDMATRRLIGDLSGGPNLTDCDTFDQNRSVFSKFYRNWYYINGDLSSQQVLRDHLDPDDTDIMAVNTIKKAGPGEQCVSSIEDIQELDASIEVFPNPTFGNIRIRVNLDAPSNLKIRIVNMMGTEVAEYESGKVDQTEIRMDLGQFASGIYMLQIESNKAMVTKKVVLSK